MSLFWIPHLSTFSNDCDADYFDISHIASIGRGNNAPKPYDIVRPPYGDHTEMGIRALYDCHKLIAGQNLM